METLVINIKNKKDSKLIRELLDRMNIEVTKEKLRQQLPKSKFKSKEEFLSFAGSMKGQLISKDHLRELSWKKRNW
jgi:hypothetical protein